jgi:prepilin-type N-terminal cleavage/methylation domain-containing protein
MSRLRGFTLIEIVIATTIMLIILLLAVPSLTGVLADKRLRRSLDGFTKLVNEARERSVAEHRSYLLVLDGKKLTLRPEILLKGEKPPPPSPLPLGSSDSLKISFPAALTEEQPNEWVFWPTGTCEPAVVEFRGRDGSWTASYAGLSPRPDLSNYVAR